MPEGSGRRVVAYPYSHFRRPIVVLFEKHVSGVRYGRALNRFPRDHLTGNISGNDRIPLDRDSRGTDNLPVGNPVAGISYFQNVRHELRKILKVRPQGIENPRLSIHVYRLVDSDRGPSSAETQQALKL